jgi:prepilin-type processing-associated H-X9-DG protein
MAVVCLLLFLAVPGLSKARRIGAAAVCQANQRALVQAWQLYAEEHGGTFVFNYHGAEALGGSVAGNPGSSPWALGWLDWTVSTDNTNILFLRREQYARLAPYLEEIDWNVHKCPADVYLSRAQAARKFKMRVRTMVMNGTVGDGNAPTGPFDPLYAQARRFSDLRFPGPDQTSVFLEEHPDSINDPFFYPPGNRMWVDVAAGLHGNASTVAFADGRVELHQWRQSLRNLRVYYTFRSPLTRVGDADISWLSFHSNRRDARSY